MKFKIRLYFFHKIGCTSAKIEIRRDNTSSQIFVKKSLDDFIKLTPT